MPRQLSFSRNLAMGLGAMVLMLALVGLTLTYWVTAFQGQARLNSQSREYALTISHALGASPPGTSPRHLNADTVEAIARAFTHDPVIASLKVLDTAGTPVFTFTREKPPATRHDVPIRHGNQQKGKVLLSLTDDVLKQQQRQVMICALFCILITVLPLFLFICRPRASRHTTRDLARMSHDVRTPMNAVIGMTELALRTDLSKKQRDYLTKIASAAHEAMRVLSDFLNPGEIRCGEPDPRENQPPERPGSPDERPGVRVPGLAKIRGARILLVEDNDINRQVAAELLKTAGFTVTIAENGQQALDHITASPFEAVLMDIQMPVMDGFTATRKIRALEPPVSKIPVIAMTAHVLKTEKEKCFDAGMNAFIAKPIDPRRLIQALVGHIPALEELPAPEPPEPVATGPDVNRADGLLLEKSLTGVDLADGMARVCGNRDRYVELLTSFAHRNRETGQEIETLILSGNFDLARTKAHTVKGMAGNLGITALYRAAENLEKAAAETDVPSGLIREFAAALDGILRQVDTLEAGLRILDEERVEPPGADALKHILDRIDQGLSRDYVLALNQAEILKSSMAGSPWESDVHTLYDMVVEFEEEKARTCLKALTRTLETAGNL